MYARINDLALEAGLYIKLDSGPYPKALTAEECSAAYQKFAELIVKECALLADKAEPYKSNDLILKHFGVDM